MITQPASNLVALAQRQPAPPESPRGLLTGVPLAQVRRLCLPPLPGPFGRLRPPLDRTAMALSLELAYMTYTLDLEPWMRAGWTDISIQVDNRLQSGVTVGESESVASERIRGLMNGWKVARARMAMREFNPVAQLMGALRQKEKSDTIKAVTMIHPVPDGRFVVAIGFMGTGSRFYDWFSNFRFTTEEGFHKGFYQLTQVFEQSATRILFPDTTAALGLSALTLADILTEMRAPDSRFTLWMAGHSQGAAVMQVFCHRLLTAWGVPLRHMVGYGFASPTTTVGGDVGDAAAYPLYHVINSDDLVPRIGALAHLGVGLLYTADASLRDAAYGWGATPEEVALREKAETLFHHITDTPTMLETLVALLTTVNEEKSEESLSALLGMRWVFAPLNKAFAFAGGKLKDTFARMARYARVAYYTLTGARMSEETRACLIAEMRPIVRELPLRTMLIALRDRFYPPHMLRRPHGQAGAYGYIATQGSERLTPFVWQADASGRLACRRASAYATFTPDARQTQSLPRRRMPPRAPAGHSPRKRGVSQRRGKRRAADIRAIASRRRRLFKPVAAAPRSTGLRFRRNA